MSSQSFDRNETNSSQPATRRSSRWARNVAVVATLTATVGALGVTSSFAATTTVAQAATTASVALSVPAAPAVATPTRLGAFDTALLKLINAKRATVGAVALREVVGLDNVSATWSTSVVSLGRYGKVVANPNVAAQTLSAAPTRGAFAQSVAKWYPQSVKVADVFSLYTAYPVAMKNLANKSYNFVGVRTTAAADGTSVATLTFTDTAIASQIVNPTTAYNPTGAITSAVQTGTSVQLRGRAADADATQALQVKFTDTVGTKVTTATVAVAGGLFAANVPIAGYGNHSICATVLNQGIGTNLSLGCTTARLGEVVGNADTLRQSGTQLTASGWGYDQGAPTTALRATVVVTGPAGTRTLTVVANGSRPDVARAFPLAGPAHGFLVATPSLGKGVNKLCVTLSPAQSASVARNLTCRTVTVA